MQFQLFSQITGTATNLSEFNYINRNGNNKMTSGFGFGLAFDGVGASAEYRETTTVSKSGKIFGKQRTGALGAGAFGVQIQSVVSDDNGHTSLAAGIAYGGSVGLFLNFSYNVELGMNAEKREE